MTNHPASTVNPVAADAGDSTAPEPARPNPGRVRLPRPSSRRWGMNPEDRMRVMETCLVLPGAGWIMHFVLMMSMSVIVANMGLSANSPALVIGAMLIAPLMTPVLGFAASIAMALGEATARTAITVLAATFGAVAVSWLIAGLFNGNLLTDEVMARTAPDLRDLIVALAAGVAGSYATARPDVSSSLPGVAIAVALVPPLAVVGITLRADQIALARGAALLYATNLAAIVAVSTAVFVATGFVPGRRLLSMAPRVIGGTLVALVVLGVFGFALAGRSIDSVTEARETAQENAAIREATETWLEGSFDEFELDVDDTTIRVLVTGPEAPPPSGDLAREIEAILGEPADLRVTWFQGETDTSLDAAEAADAAVARWQAQENQVVETIREWLVAHDTNATPELSSLVIDSAGITAEIASMAEPPPQEDLVRLIETTLGEQVPVQVGWRDLSAELAEAERIEREQLESAARVAAQDWAAVNQVDIASVLYDGELLLVNVIGETQPTEGSLEADLRAAVPDVGTIRVYFIDRQLIVPAPTPTPTPTPTAVPTPTPTPEPTPDETGEGEGDGADEGEG